MTSAHLNNRRTAMVFAVNSIMSTAAAYLYEKKY